MPEDTKNTPDGDQPVSKQPVGSAAEPKNTDTPPTDGGNAEHMIPKSRFDEINTQYKELKSEWEKLEKEKAEAERQAAEEQGKFKELYEKAQAKAEEAQQKARELELSMLRQRVAQDVELPQALADRLVGETEEELRADAEALLETLPKEDKKAPELNGGAGNRKRNQKGDSVPTMAEIKEMAAVYGVSESALKEQYGLTD